MKQRTEIRSSVAVSTALPQIPKSVLKRLGTMPDAKLSRQTGCTEGALRRCREVLGIEKFSRANELKSDRRALAIIKSTSVRSAADKLGASRPTIQKVRDELGLGPAATFRPPTKTYPKALIRRLGETYDSVLAKQYGMPRETVRSLRQRRGIPGMPNDKGRDRIELPTHILKRLGKDYDCALANETGHCCQTIATRRKELGIPSYRPAFFQRNTVRKPPSVGSS